MKIIKIEQFGEEYKITEIRQRTAKAVPKVEAVASEDNERFSNNVSRARSRIFELAACNDWEYFCTLTLSSEYDRHDLNGWQKAFSQWLRDYRKKGYDVKYLLVPEQHKDGSWHMHGFFSGIGEAVPFTAEDIGGFGTSAAVAAFKAAELNKGEYLNWRDYSRRWGYCTLAKVRNKQAVARYVTKYVTKDIALDNLISGAHLFYASRGLASAKPLAWNAIPLDDREFRDLLSEEKHFCNEYVEQWWTSDPSKIAPLCNIITGEKFEFTK